MPKACARMSPHPPGSPTVWCPCMTSTGRRKRLWPKGLARILAGGSGRPAARVVPGTHLRAGHPRPDLDEFVRQYRKAGGQIDMTVFEGEGEGLLRDLPASGPAGARADDRVHLPASRVSQGALATAVTGTRARCSSYSGTPPCWEEGSHRGRCLARILPEHDPAAIAGGGERRERDLSPTLTCLGPQCPGAVRCYRCT